MTSLRLFIFEEWCKCTSAPDPHPDRQDPHFFWPPGSVSRSVNQRYGSVRGSGSLSGSVPYQVSRIHNTGTKSLGQSGDLQIHLRVPTGEKYFSCPYCIKSFARSADLQKHSEFTLVRNRLAARSVQSRIPSQVNCGDIWKFTQVRFLVTGILAEGKFWGIFSGAVTIHFFMYRRRILCTFYGAVVFLIFPSKSLYGWEGGGGCPSVVWPRRPIMVNI